MEEPVNISTNSLSSTTRKKTKKKIPENFNWVKRNGVTSVKGKR